MATDLAARMWTAVLERTRPVLYAGVDADLARAEARELVTANLVVLLSIAVTIPDILNFRSLHTDLGNQAAVFAATATGIYIASYGLLAAGRRWLGTCVFANTVLWVLAVNIVLVGTDLGNQYYFVIVGVGVAFVWPRHFAYMRFVHSALGLLVFIGVMLVARPTPLAGPAIPASVAMPMLFIHATSAYLIAIGFVLYSLSLTRRAELALQRERERSEELLQREVAYQVAERSKQLAVTLSRNEGAVGGRTLENGERFAGRYRVVRSLGAGGMGAVYEVERATDGTHLALKILVSDSSAASAARFAREAEIGARVRHPNVVSIVDVGVAERVPFLVMELVRGGTLEHCRHRFGDVGWALPMLCQVADGLAALHDAGVVHRDLKPSNVLLADEASAHAVKISDFGIARFGLFAESTSPALTMTGAMIGTPMYMAPETGSSSTPHASADIFSFGVLAAEVLCGRAPFSSPPVLLAMARALPEPILGGDLPPAIRQLIRACLAPDPTFRPTVTEIQAVLRPVPASV